MYNCTIMRIKNNKNIKYYFNKTNMSKIRIVGVKYTKDTFTDFEIMMHHPDYSNALFIFNDNETEHRSAKKGNGNAVVRPFNNYSSLEKPKSFGIPTGKYRTGYVSYHEGIQAVYMACQELSGLIQKHGYDTIVYCISDLSHPLMGCEIFHVDRDILRYITRYILCMGKEYMICSKDGYSNAVDITAELVNNI